MVSVPRVLGYDAREKWMDPPAAGARVGGWDIANKRTWLLRSNVTRPLSVDHLVWASVFDAEPNLPRPTYATGFIQDLWSMLSHLRHWLGDHKVHKAYSIICITLEPNDEDLNVWEHILERTDPAHVDKSWTFLGYDVADRWLLSGLSNCTHCSEADFIELQSHFGPFINEYHLFDEIRIAEEFRAVSNMRVRDHAPFYVHGIRVID
jgi:hypothetical protein